MTSRLYTLLYGCVPLEGGFTITRRGKGLQESLPRQSEKSVYKSFVWISSSGCWISSTAPLDCFCHVRVAMAAVTRDGHAFVAQVATTSCKDSD